MLKLRLVMLLAAVAVAGCSLKKTAEQMKDTSKTIEKHSGHLSKRTNDLEYYMSKLYADQELEKQLDLLFQENLATNQSGLGRLAFDYLFGKNTESSLLVSAGVAMHAMYFQTWKADFGEEDFSTLDERFKLSLEVLFGRMIANIPSDYQVDVLRPNRSYIGVASLGAKMDQMDQRFARLLKAEGMPHLSLYEVIAGTLKNRAYESMLPVATYTILTRRREAVYLLQLRQNILPMMVVSRMTDFKDRGDVGRLLMRFRGQKVSLDKISTEELQEWTGWLRDAEQTRSDLKAMGEQPEYNRMFSAIEAGVDFGQQGILENQKSSSLSLPSRNAVTSQFAALYNRVVEQAQH